MGFSGTTGSPFLKVIFAPMVGGVIFSYIINTFQIEEIHQVGAGFPRPMGFPAQ